MGNSFRENVKDELSFLGITAKELSQKAKIPYQTLENYLNSRATIPPADYACRIAKVLNTSVENLLGGEDNSNALAEDKKQEKHILTLISRLSPENKKAILQVLTTMVRGQT
ncbi:XRE family transcriptional regulator [Treponema ruminis]|uniref:Transcriptional regulator with XRE-family HTH domain n=1 Tax=Treponema ruminis TaxID=744515 RepID=A0A7W8G7U0_9SPIR|nr:helix-turn-helix transcriptional regulator [Treponema ruminis]MBB5225463.1 transcriptional regulator with XRE-family HTH domain [Treponema ruminis]QSI01668.1 XRE family transcriptional regulator [Treponema ruminis]